MRKLPILLLTAVTLVQAGMAGQSVANDVDHESRDRPKLLDRTCESLTTHTIGCGRNLFIGRPFPNLWMMEAFANI